MHKKDIAVQFGFLSSTVSMILKDHELIMKALEDVGPDRKHSKTCYFDKVDNAVLKWIKIICNKNLPISGPFIKEKALEFANCFGKVDFQTSSGWLDKF